MFRVERDSKLSVNISGGPLAYRYQFEEIYIHYGTENNQGSEHQIDGYTFPGEVSKPSFPHSYLKAVVEQDRQLSCYCLGLGSPARKLRKTKKIAPYFTDFVYRFFKDPIIRFQQGVVSEHVRGAAQVAGHRGHLTDGANRRHAQSRASYHNKYV